MLGYNSPRFYTYLNDQYLRVHIVRRVQPIPGNAEKIMRSNYPPNFEDTIGVFLKQFLKNFIPVNGG